MAVMCEEKLKPWQVTCVPQAGATGRGHGQCLRSPVSEGETTSQLCGHSTIPKSKGKVRTSELNETPEGVLVRSTGHNR